MRSFAYALLDRGAVGPVACLSAHLKINTDRTGMDIGGQENKNIYKREAVSAQILAAVRKMQFNSMFEQLPNSANFPSINSESCPMRHDLIADIPGQTAHGH